MLVDGAKNRLGTGTGTGTGTWAGEGAGVVLKARTKQFFSNASG